MDRSAVIYLIATSYTEDEYGVLQPAETKRKAYANVTSVSATEFFDGGRNGLNPELRVTMFGPDYKGETIVEIGGKRYAVYRTYFSRNDTLELYLQRKEGDRHGKSND